MKIALYLLKNESERIACDVGEVVESQSIPDTLELLDSDLSKSLGKDVYFSANYSKASSAVGLYLTLGKAEEQSYCFRANFQLGEIPAYHGFRWSDEYWIEIYVEK